MFIFGNRLKKPPKLKTKLGWFEEYLLSFRGSKDGNAKGNAIKKDENEGVYVSAFIYREIDKFFLLRDGRLINQIISLELNGKKAKQPFIIWMSTLDKAIGKAEESANQRLVVLEAEKKRLEETLVGNPPSDYRQNALARIATASAEILRITSELTAKLTAYRKAQLGLIDEIEPFFESHLNYYRQRIVFYYENVRKRYGELPIIPPTHDINKLLRAVSAEGTLLGRYEEIRNEIKTELGDMEALV
jgi:hypothetical protein